MKKFLVILLVIVISLAFVGNVVAGPNDIRVILNGSEVNFEVKPLLINDRTMIPLRSIFEEVGGTVEWLELPYIEFGNGNVETLTRQCVYISVCGHRIRLEIGSNVATVDWNDDIVVDVPPALIDGRTYIPLRFIAESTGAVVGWDGETSTITIDTPLPDYSPKNYESFPQVPNFQQICGWPHIEKPDRNNDSGVHFEYFTGNVRADAFSYMDLLKSTGFKQVDISTGTKYFSDDDLLVAVGWDYDFVYITVNTENYLKDYDYIED